MGVYKFGDVSASAGGKFITTIHAETMEEAEWKFCAKELHPEKNVLKRQFGMQDENGIIVVSTGEGDLVDMIRLSECSGFDYSKAGIDVGFKTKEELREKISQNAKKIEESKNLIAELEIENKQIIDRLEKAVEEYDYGNLKFKSSLKTSLFQFIQQVNNPDSVFVYDLTNIDIFEKCRKLSLMPETDNKTAELPSSSLTTKIDDETIGFLFNHLKTKVSGNTIFIYRFGYDNTAFAFGKGSCRVLSKDMSLEDYDKFLNSVIEVTYGKQLKVINKNVKDLKTIENPGTASMKMVDVSKLKSADLICAYLFDQVGFSFVETVLGLKEKNAEEFSAYLEKNDKKIGIDGNIAVSMTLESKFEELFNSSMKNVSIAKLKKIVAGMKEENLQK